MNEKSIYNTEYDDTADGKFYTIPMDPEMRHDIEEVCKLAKLTLSKKHSIIVPKIWQINTIANCFIESLIMQMVKKMQESNSPIETINFNDTLEFHLSYKRNDDAEKEGNLNITIRPGVNAKLLVKSDAITEMDADD